MRRYSVFFATFGLIWGLVILFMGFFFFLSWVAFGFDVTGLKIAILLDITFIIALVIFMTWMNKEKKNPMSRLNSEMMAEMRKNGVSDHFFEIAAQGVRMYDGEPGNFVYYKNFLIYGAEAYLQREQYDKALEYLGMVDLNQLKAKDMKFFDYGYGLAAYYEVMMTYCELTNDRVRAENVMNDAKPVIDSLYGKDHAVNMLIDNVYYEYSYLNQDYILAKQHAENIVNNPFHHKHKMAVGQLCLAMVYNKLGDEVRKAYFLDEASKLAASSGNPISAQSLELTQKRMARND